MKTRNIFLAVLAVTTVISASNLAFAQNYTSQRSSWSSSSRSAWSSGPGGTHVSGDSKTSSSSTSTAGGSGGSNTVSQKHSQQQGFARGSNANGVYGSNYQRQNGKQSHTQIANGYNGRPIAITKRESSYDNSDGNSYLANGNGVTTSKFRNRAGQTTLTNAAMGRTTYGRPVLVGNTQTNGFKNTSSTTRGYNHNGGFQNISKTARTYGQQAGILMLP